VAHYSPAAGWDVSLESSSFHRFSLRIWELEFTTIRKCEDYARAGNADGGTKDFRWGPYRYVVPFVARIGSGEDSGFGADLILFLLLGDPDVGRISV
jgi:hypothetical protein